MEDLAAEGWVLKKGAGDTLTDVVNEQHISFREAALKADLRKIGDAALPEGISRTAGPLKGPHVLQIMSCVDVGHPSKGGVTGSSAKRLLCFKLTDGNKSCKALEFRPIQGAESDSIAPGAKVLIAGATVKAGIILVDAKSLELLGGRVDELYEAWDFQKKFGGSARPAAAADPAAELDRPPQFKTFVPGKTHVPKKPPADSGTNGHSVDQVGASDTSQARPVGRGAITYAPPGFENHPASQMQSKLQQPHSAADQSQAAAPASRAAAQHNAPAWSMSARDAATQKAAPRAAMPLPGEAAARQLQGSSAAKSRLQERLAANEEDQRGQGRGRGRGRGRRGRYRDDEEEAGMTLEEWEAQQGAQNTGAAGAPLSDEELARQLQRQLDMEDAALAAAQHDREPPRSAEEDLRATLFAFDQPSEGRHDRGRGFRRGGRGRGRRY